MNIVDRLKIYMEHTGLQISQFADAALIPRPTLSQILSGRNKKISNEVLEKLHDAFPNLNVAWLLFGDGDMVKSGSEPSRTATQDNSRLLSNAAAIPQQQTSIQEPIQNPRVTLLSGIPPKANTVESHSSAMPQIESASSSTKDSNPQIALAPDSNKKIQTIMVFYTDNSFEIFTPSQR